MKKRIFWSMFFTSLATLLITASIIIFALYQNFDSKVKKEIAIEADYISIGLSQGGKAYLEQIGKATANRITLIDTLGTVIYDSTKTADKLENHLNRPEVADAIKYGTGEVTRFSSTMSEETYYFAKNLESGKVLRIASQRKSSLIVIISAFGWTVPILFSLLLATIFIAKKITKKIIEPINKIDLDKPLSNNSYDELSPLLLRMNKQNKMIKKQMSLIQKKQNEFEYITDSMSEGLILLDKNGMVLTANKSAKALFDPNEEKGSFLTLCRDIEFIKAVENALSGKKSEMTLQKLQGTFQITATPVLDNKPGNAVVLLAIDITQREQSERIRREFSANVSHELKTPLTSIIGYAEIIKNGIAKPEDTPRFIDRIYWEGSRLLALIEDIIKISRLDEIKIKEEFCSVDLQELCQKVINQLTDKAEENKISIEYKGVKSIILGIAPTLYEMIFNLCDNAIIYNTPGGNVKVHIKNIHGKIVLSVADNGIGVCDEDQNRIFERFYRVDKSHSKGTGGTGLGLSIVKHAAILHGAEIKIASEISKGTKITIIFPNIQNV